MSNLNKFEEKSINKLILEYSLPATIGMLMTFSYNIIDRMFVGNKLGAEALTGVALVFPLQVIIFGLAFMIGIGANSNVSLSLGRKDKDAAEKFLGNAVSLSVIFPIISIIIITIFFDSFLDLLGSYGSVRNYTYSFLQISLFGMVFQSMTMGLNNLIRATGFPTIAMLTQMIGAALNIVLDYIFIFVFDWGVEGAAIATNIAMFVSALWVIIFFFTKKSNLKIKLNYLKLHKKIMLPLLGNGFPSFITQVSGSIVVLLLNRQLINLGGHQGVAILSIISGIEAFMFVPIIGISIGLRPIIGYNFGAKNYIRTKKILLIGTYLTFGIGFISFVFLQIFSEYLITFFVPNDPNLIKIGANAMRIFTFFIYLVGLEIIVTMYYQSIGNSKIAAITTLNRQLIFLLPLVFILPQFFGLNGVWYAGASSDLFSSILSIIFIVLAVRKLNKMELHKSLQTENAD